MADRRVPLRTGRGNGPTPEVRRLVLERDAHCCVCCSKSIAGHPYSLLTRLRPSEGGSSNPENLITVLGRGGEGCCGRIALHRAPADEVNGYRLRRGQDPAAVPIIVATRAGPARVWLLPGGSRSVDPPEQATEAPAAIHRRAELGLTWDEVTAEEQHATARRLALALLRAGRRAAEWFPETTPRSPLFALVADVMAAEATAREARGRLQALAD